MREFKRLAQGECGEVSVSLGLSESLLHSKTASMRVQKVLIVALTMFISLPAARMCVCVCVGACGFRYSKSAIHACQQTPKFQQKSVNHNRKTQQQSGCKCVLRCMQRCTQSPPSSLGLLCCLRFRRVVVCGAQRKKSQHIRRTP